MRGHNWAARKCRAKYSTIGVFPVPPHVKLPTLITGMGSLQFRGNISGKKSKHALIKGKTQNFMNVLVKKQIGLSVTLLTYASDIA